ncbi:MAG: ABC transporter ATP-binding protein [Desulfuromonadales bacterium]
MNPLVDVCNISFSYSSDKAHSIFRDVSFSIKQGDIFCILGPNGTGKTTLLKCVGNVIQGWSGTVNLDGRDISILKTSEVARGIGYVPQNQAPSFPFLVRDIVVMGRAPHLNVFSSPSKNDRDIACDAMEMVGILPLAERPCTMLSGGEWQLTLIARALAQEPRVMILDEPASHLDLGNQLRILRVVKSLAESGIGIVMATHFPDHAFIVATETAIMNHGIIAHRGPPEEVITDRNMRETYGVDVKVIQVGEGVGRKACFTSL